MLAKIASEIHACTACPLHATRTHAVPGEGPPEARVVFIGEAPGGDEDLQGRPFVGRSGQLLRKTIRETGWREDEVFIGNVLKCRPPNNADPVPEQVEACRHFLMAQLVILRPKVIVTLGRHSLNLLISPELKITKIRGQHIKKNGQLYLPTYHPAMILRNARLEPEFRHDLAKAKALCERS
ncbi:uracil-DNA glycosylase [bacterium]|nr:uracil-DNA glycosylase [bacterium]